MPLSLSALMKARRDRLFASAIRQYGEECLESAGFFDDGTEPGTDMAQAISVRLPVTSLNKVVTRLASLSGSVGKAVVLVTSGGFCPIHPGHIAMMESARREVESRGFFVAGGFITPDHDQYVQSKCGSEAIPAPYRIDLVSAATATSDWLDVDPWAALYLDRAINFSDIIRRMELYLAHHLRQEIEVFFVCGSDNAGFSRAFNDHSALVLVPRTGTTNLADRVRESERVMVCKDHIANDLSSTKVRSSQPGATAVQSSLYAREVLQDRKPAIEQSLRWSEPARVTILLRDEEEWAVSHWATQFGEPVIEAQRRFAQGVATLCERIYRVGYPGAEVSVRRLSLSHQTSFMQSRLRQIPLPSISLDPCIQGDWNIDVSRLFSLNDTKRLTDLVSRPGSSSLQDQLAKLPPGDYVLFDDDIATGKTIERFVQQLPTGVNINQILTGHREIADVSLNTAEGYSGDHLSDIGDIRDFLIGAKQGGLVARLFDGTITRVPYLAPYVSNTSRMSIPVSHELEFSRRLWELNCELFADIPSPIRVRDCEPTFHRFALFLGFTQETTLLDICEWHMQILRH